MHGDDDAEALGLEGSGDLLRISSLQQIQGTGDSTTGSGTFEDLQVNMEGLNMQGEAPATNGDLSLHSPGSGIPIPNLLQAAAMLDPQYQQQVVQRVAQQQATAGLSGGALSVLQQPMQLVSTSPAVLQMQQSLIGLLASPAGAGGGAPHGLASSAPPPLSMPLPAFQPAVEQQYQALFPAAAAGAGSSVGMPGSPYPPATVVPPPNYMVPLEAVGASEGLQPSASAAGGRLLEGLPQSVEQQPQRARQRQQSAGSAAAAGDSGVEQPRRRGRKPKDADLLTEKQLRAREAQKRFRERQRSRVLEAEEGLETVGAELERERAQHDSAQLTNAVYEHMLQYKEQMLGALQSAHEFDPPPGIVIPPSMVEVMRREQVTRAYTPESIMRYAAGGFTKHLDESGRVKEAPPFEAIAKDWSDIVEGLRRVMLEARAGATNGAENGHAERADDAGPVPAPQRGAVRESAPGELVELQSKGSRGPAAPFGGTVATSATHSSSSAQQAPAQQQQRVSAQAPGTGGGPSPGVVSPKAGDVGEEASSRPAEQMLGNAASSKKLPWAMLDKGLELRDGDDLYRFTGPQLRTIAKLLKRSGALCWQQAILFPDNIMKLIALRMDTYEVCQEEEELPRWRQVVRQLRLSSSQLEALVALHSDFLAMLRPALAERRAALRRLQEVRALTVGINTSQHSHLQRTLVVSECTSSLIHSVQTQNAAAVALTAGIFNLLDFPMQKMKLIVLSWPFYPQVHLIGTAAAMELGLDMALYNAFNGLDGLDPQEEEGEEEGEAGGGRSGGCSVVGEGVGAGAAAVVAEGGAGLGRGQREQSQESLLVDVKMEYEAD